MKWGKKKPISSNSSFSSLPNCSQPSSLISHVFPVSWLSKFKHKKTAKSEPNPKEKLSSVSGNNGNGKFYYASEDNDDAFWRLSFRQDNAGEKSKRVGLKPSVWFSDHLEQEALSNCPNCGRKEAQKLKRSPRRAKSARELKRSSKEEDSCDDKTSFNFKSQREMKVKNEEQRKSFYVSMENQKQQTGNNRVKAYSPRTALRGETCKVKAIEDMKKANLKKRKKKKKKRKEERVGSKTGLDSFAVVKSSYDPEKDFKDSMVEMISEKKMSKADELEDLLACYLTLNSDECHGLIVKVFREVWLEFGESKNQQVFSE